MVLYLSTILLMCQQLSALVDVPDFRGPDVAVMVYLRPNFLAVTLPATRPARVAPIVEAVEP